MDKPEKLNAEAASTHHAEHSLGRFAEGGEKGRIDAMAEAPDVSMATFAHLDEKKILRKVCMDIDCSARCQSNIHQLSRWICG